MKKIKVLCCCGAGMGTCMLLRTRVERTFKKLGVEAKFDNESVAIAKTIYRDYDYVFCNHNLVSSFTKADEYKTVIIGLTNVTDVKEIEEKFLEHASLDELKN